MAEKQFSLNTAQQKVLDHQSGPLLVVAGAGTGKTRVIVEKVNQLLKSGVKPQEILALTFTEKAAAEMLDRIVAAQEGYLPELPVMTFNAYGAALLEEFNVDAGLSRNHLLLGENAKIVFLRQNLASLQLDYFSPLSNPEGLLPDVADYFSKLKQHVITPKLYADFVKTMPSNDEAEVLEKTKHQELARAYELYLQLCKRQNVIDYDDQIYQAIQLLENRPNIRETLRSRYQIILVDEFQDTNPMQSRLIDLIFQPHTRNTTNDQRSTTLIAVGDDDQSIYGFRGATLANILEFKQRFPSTKEVTLTENYRCSQAILDASYQLIQHNNPHRLEPQLGINKQLHAQFAGQPPRLYEFSSLSSELQWIAEDIKTRLSEGQLPGTIAILCRRNKVIPELHEALELAGVEHVIIGEKYQLYKTDVVRAMLEALRAVTDPRASTSLYHTLAGPLFNVSRDTLSEAASQARYDKNELEAHLTQLNDSEYQPALKLIQSWREASADMSVGKLLYSIIEDSGYKDRLYQAAMDDEVAALQVTQLAQFFRTLKEFESVAPMPTALQYLDSFPVLEAAGETDEDGTLDVSNEMVNILTIHKAKGLEWQTVYIPDCTEGAFPLRRRSSGIAVPEKLITTTSSEADDHYSEERRLMYVALTRAKENLVLSYALKHHTPTPKKSSRFLTEIWPDLQPHRQPQKQTTMFELADISAGVASPKTISLPRSVMQNGTLKLSVSQISCFLDCPLNFYYRYVLNVPEPPNAAASYGTAIHAAIEAFNLARSKNESVELSQLQEIIKAKWSNGGYLSQDHALKAKQQALQTIAQFFESHQTDTPSKIEWPFSVRLFEPQLIITGRLDAVFESSDKVEIRDYKTSTSVTTEQKAKQRATSSDQLTLYALVWQELYGKLPTFLSLEFVDTNLIGSVKKTQRGIDGMYTKLTDMVADISANNFPPLGEHRFCNHPSV